MDARLAEFSHDLKADILFAFMSVDEGVMIGVLDQVRDPIPPLQPSSVH